MTYLENSFKTYQVWEMKTKKSLYLNLLDLFFSLSILFAFNCILMSCLTQLYRKIFNVHELSVHDCKVLEPGCLKSKQTISSKFSSIILFLVMFLQTDLTFLPKFGQNLQKPYWPSKDKQILYQSLAHSWNDLANSY